MRSCPKLLPVLFSKTGSDSKHLCDISSEQLYENSCSRYASWEHNFFLHIFSNVWSLLYLLCSFKSSWLVQITHPYVTVCTHPMCRSVWGLLRFSAYAYLVTLKMVSRLCVSLCEAGVESFLFICPPVCLQYIRSTASVLTSSLRPISLSCSTDDSEDHRASRGLAMWPLSSWEFSQGPGVKPPLYGGW